MQNPIEIMQRKFRLIDPDKYIRPTNEGRKSHFISENDADVFKEYLYTRYSNIKSRNSAESAIRKLFVFMILRGIKALADFNASNCKEFQNWLTDKDGSLSLNAELLIYGARKPGENRRYYLDNGSPNPNWKPFNKPMTDVSAQQTCNKVSTFFEILHRAGYLPLHNPFSIVEPITTATLLSDARVTNDSFKESRSLPHSVILAVSNYLDFGKDFTDYPELSDVEYRSEYGLPPLNVLPIVPPTAFARRRWLFYFYLYTAARISSGLNATLDDIYIGANEEQILLQLYVKGKGTKTHSVPWIKELEDEYYRYRAAMGLEPFKIKPALHQPAIDRKIRSDLGHRHLILPLKLHAHKQDRPMSYTPIHIEIKSLFEYAHRWALRNQHLGLTEKELSLCENASTHWIRHGTASLMGDYAKELLGHRVETTTDTYRDKNYRSQEALLKNMLDENPQDAIFSQLLESDHQTRKRWIDVLTKSLEN